LALRTHNLAQQDHQELMAFPETMAPMVYLVHLDHQVHPDLQVLEEMVAMEVVWVHLAHLAMLVKLVFPV